MNWGRGHFRQMPEDFLAHAEESIPQLIRRYRSSQATVTRWKELCGTQAASCGPDACEVIYPDDDMTRRSGLLEDD